MGHCGLDLVENCLQHDVVSGLAPIAPDLFVLTEGFAVDGVANESAAGDAFEFEPMLDLKLVGAHNAEGPRRTGPVVLLPEHWRRLIEALTLRARRRRDLPRPNPVEVGDERRDLLRRRSDRAIVRVTHLHYSDSDHWDRRTIAAPVATRPPAEPPAAVQRWCAAEVQLRAGALRRTAF